MAIASLNIWQPTPNGNGNVLQSKNGLGGELTFIKILKDSVLALIKSPRLKLHGNRV
jgi:hypothetical protein